MGTRPPQASRVLSASEIGQYTYCSNAWYLRRQGHQPESPGLNTGTDRHTDLGYSLESIQRRQRHASRALALGLLLLLLSLLALFLGVVL